MPDPAYGSLQFEEAIRFFRGKLRNLPSERFSDVWREQHDTAFMVAGAVKADLLNDLRISVERAIKDGTSLDQFRREFDQIVARHGWQYRGSRNWRTRVIYETNLRTAYQAGRYAQLTDPDLLDSRPFWRYKHNEAVQHPRPLHLSWDGLVLRHDDPWWRAHWPPNGWGCKCRVIAMSERQLRKAGKPGPDRAPDDGTYEWVDKATGEVHTVPRGIDPGWDYAPGASQAEAIRAQLAGKLDTLPPQIGESFRLDLDNVPTPPPPPPPLAAPEMFSTVAGYSRDGVDAILRAVPGAAARTDAIAEFIDASGLKALVLQPTQVTNRQKAAAMANQVGEFLGVDGVAAYRLFHYRDRNAGGFTAQPWSHIVVKAKASEKAAKTQPEKLAAAVSTAIERHRGNNPAWTITRVYDELAGSKMNPVGVLVHELMHQVHFKAGAPPVPAGMPALTLYGRVNSKEWHAEMLSAWLFNRDALAEWNQSIAEYLDNVVTRAISTVRRP